MRPTYVRDDKFTGSGRAFGSREHFFHFLIGYLLPIIHAHSQRRQDARFQVLDCGPVMTPILEETLKRLELNFQITTATSIKNPVVVDSWDNPMTPWSPALTQALRFAAEQVSTAWEVHRCEQDNCPQTDNLLIQRSAAHEFYTKGGAEIKGYGLSRRSITNWGEVQSFLRERSIDYALYEPGKHSLGCQIATFRRARRIIAMRGAELANAVWAQKGARARILNPRTMRPPKCLGTFFVRLQFRHQFISVHHDHARADPAYCADFFLGP